MHNIIDRRAYLHWEFVIHREGFKSQANHTVSHRQPIISKPSMQTKLSPCKSQYHAFNFFLYIYINAAHVNPCYRDEAVMKE